MSRLTQKEQFLDSAWVTKGAAGFVSLPEAQKIVKNHQFGKTRSTLFSHGRRTESFFTENSGLYITPRDYQLARKGVFIKRSTSARKLDGISSRVLHEYRNYRPAQEDFLHKQFLKKCGSFKDGLSLGSSNFIRLFLSPARIWNFAIVGAILFGMVSMTFIYRYLGEGALAGNAKKMVITNMEVIESQSSSAWANPLVLGAETFADKQAKESDSDDEAGYIIRIMKELEEGRKEEFEKEVRSIVKGHPIEKMLPYIMEKDQIVVAFLIGIAKKESNWGKRVPLLNGQDCYNYWGYRGKRKLMGTAGHTCFNSRKDAVDTVAKRLKTLIEDKELNTPSKLVIWKCGSACAQDDQAAVQKWISDVNLYFQKLND
jgi:hypothetical protein